MPDTASTTDPPQGTAEPLTQDGGRGWRREQKEREASRSEKGGRGEGAAPWQSRDSLTAHRSPVLEYVLTGNCQGIPDRDCGPWRPQENLFLYEELQPAERIQAGAGYK